MTEDTGVQPPEWVQTYEAGLVAYEDRPWTEAVRLFAAAAYARGGVDRPSEILTECCRT